MPNIPHCEPRNSLILNRNCLLTKSLNNPSNVVDLTGLFKCVLSHQIGANSVNLLSATQFFHSRTVSSEEIWAIQIIFVRSQVLCVKDVGIFGRHTCPRSQIATLGKAFFWVRRNLIFNSTQFHLFSRNFFGQQPLKTVLRPPSGPRFTKFSGQHPPEGRCHFTRFHITFLANILKDCRPPSRPRLSRHLKNPHFFDAFPTFCFVEMSNFRKHFRLAFQFGANNNLKLRF